MKAEFGAADVSENKSKPTEHSLLSKFSFPDSTKAIKDRG